MEDLDGSVLVFATTDDRETQEMIRQQADKNGQLLNVADDPESCSFHVPATVRQGDLTIAVSTSGKSPAVATNWPEVTSYPIYRDLQLKGPGIMPADVMPRHSFCIRTGMGCVTDEMTSIKSRVEQRPAFEKAMASKKTAQAA